jgi:DNA/RNA endonuclease G (NUC1)
MKKMIILLVAILISMSAMSQLVATKNKLILNHGDMILYLSNDTLPMVSRHSINYSKFKLDSDRDNKWFQDKYKKMNKNVYKKSGYDLGHLTPSHITSYDDTLNHKSFSLYNQAPQLSKFNKGNWNKLEKSVEDSINKYKYNVTIITGVIYDSTCKFLPGSKIKIPTHYFKIAYIGKKTYCWIGSNTTCEVKPIKLIELNAIFEKNKMGLTIK